MTWKRFGALAVAGTAWLAAAGVLVPANEASAAARPLREAVPIATTDGVRPDATAGASATSPGASYFPVSPTRIADTRRSFGTAPVGRPSAGATVTVQITGRSEIAIPDDAVAVVLNVTAAAADDAGYVTVYPTGTPLPTASNLNLSGRGYTGANLVTVALGSHGSISMFTSAATDLLVDVAGYERAVAGPVAGGRTLTTGPRRLYDTRSGVALGAGELRTITLDGIPAGVSAVVLNVTATNTKASGFWSIVPIGAPLDGAGAPTTSNLNVPGAGVTTAGQVIVPVGADHRISAYTNGGGDLLLDLFGYVTDDSAPASTDGLFVPLSSPFRLIDTRSSFRTWPGWTIEVPVLGRGGIPAGGVAAIVGNLTTVDAHDAGYVSAFPAGTAFPGTSNVNTDRAGMVVPNHMITPISARGVSLLAASGGHLLLDAAGYLTGTAQAATQAPPVNVMPIPAFPLRLRIPAIGVDQSVQPDAQPASLLHGPGWWPGTSYPGVNGNMGIFGHRTEAGGPFRQINRLKAGDTIVLTGDHRTSVYEVQGWKVVPAGSVNDYLGASDTTMLTLIACTRPDGTPTSLAYRIIVTATLRSYADA